jgi:hypothetical protein
MWTTQAERDSLTKEKPELEASMQKEWEECGILCDELQQSKDQQGVLQNELATLKADLEHQVGAFKGHNPVKRGTETLSGPGRRSSS